MGFGARIAEFRRGRNESLQQVADKVGVTKTHIWELERGRTKNPSLTVHIGDGMPLDSSKINSTPCGLWMPANASGVSSFQSFASA